MSLRKSDITMIEGLSLYDTPSRQFAKSVVPKVVKEIHRIDDHPNQYSIDLIGYDASNQQIAYIEVETSTAWKTPHFPWPRLSFLEERKGRYLYRPEYQQLDMYFVMFNHNFTSFAITTRANILASPIETDHRTWKGKEQFRMIERTKFQWYRISDLS